LARRESLARNVLTPSPQSVSDAEVWLSLSVSAAQAPLLARVVTEAAAGNLTLLQRAAIANASATPGEAGQPCLLGRLVEGAEARPAARHNATLSAGDVRVRVHRYLYAVEVRGRPEGLRFAWQFDFGRDMWHVVGPVPAVRASLAAEAGGDAEGAQLSVSTTPLEFVLGRGRYAYETSLSSPDAAALGRLLREVALARPAGSPRSRVASLATDTLVDEVYAAVRDPSFALPDLTAVLDGFLEFLLDPARLRVGGARVEGELRAFELAFSHTYDGWNLPGYPAINSDAIAGTIGSPPCAVLALSTRNTRAWGVATQTFTFAVTWLHDDEARAAAAATLARFYAGEREMLLPMSLRWGPLSADTAYRVRTPPPQLPCVATNLSTSRQGDACLVAARVWLALPNPLGLPLPARALAANITLATATAPPPPPLVCRAPLNASRVTLAPYSATATLPLDCEAAATGAASEAECAQRGAAWRAADARVRLAALEIEIALAPDALPPIVFRVPLTEAHAWRVVD
jgi:hypothetical protein